MLTNRILSCPGTKMPVFNRRLTQLFFALVCFFVVSGQSSAATVPQGFQDIPIASGFSNPTTLTALPDGRVLVVQQNGTIRMIKNDSLLGTPFWTVPGTDSSGEHGCLGITPDPNFSANRFIYIYCTVSVSGGVANRVFRVTEANDVMVPGSEQAILTLPNVPSGNRFHMGGALRFGVDGKLYIAVGNHEDSPRNPSFSQNLNSPFGKMLRINPNGTVPNDNPYFNTPGAYQAIYNLGHRNPFAFDIQPGTGRLLIGDVGQGAWEEVNDGLRGVNYGWPFFEGNSQRLTPPGGTVFTPPLFAFDHGGACAITGVAFYNPASQQFPQEYVGKLLYQDFCGGYIRSLNPATGATAAFATGISSPTNLIVAPSGSVYYVARGSGSLGKIIYSGSQAPQINVHPQDRTAFLGSSVTFTVAANGATSFQWLRNGINISGATSASYTINNIGLADNGARFSAVARNASGSVTSNEATLTVTSDTFPVATIDLPTANSYYLPGDLITYSGRGTDVEDGALPPGALTWRTTYQHDAHAHDLDAPVVGVSGGSFMMGDFEGNEPNTWLRLHLTVRDSAGQTHSTFRDIYPAIQLSTLNPVGTPVNGFGPIERDKSNGEAAANDGRTMAIAGIEYAKGWGVHAPSDIRFNLGGNCSGRFIADVGIDDESPINGSVVFQVFTDGIKVYDSGIVRSAELRRTVNVSIAGTNELRLVVTDSGNGTGSDHADWAATRITGCNFSGGSSSRSSSSSSRSSSSLSSSLSSSSSLSLSSSNNAPYGYTISGQNANFFVNNAPWADIHYFIPGVTPSQQNFRMTQNGSASNYTVTNIPNGSLVQYYFTIGLATGGAMDTGWTQFVMQGGTGSSPSSSSARSSNSSLLSSSRSSLLPSSSSSSLSSSSSGGAGLPFCVSDATRSFVSNPFSVSGSTTVSVDIEGSTAATLEVTDYFRLYYRLNGGVRQTISLNTDGFARRTSSVTFTGSGNLVVEADAFNTAADERYCLHGINVTTGSSGSSSSALSSVSSSASSSSSGSVQISGLSVNDTANAADWSVQSNLQIGNTVYGDRTFTFTAIPSTLAGSAWIRPANDSKSFTGNPTATFTLSAPASVYLALNTGGAVPSWVDASWTNTGTTLSTRESGTSVRTYNLYVKSFNAGAVALGPWSSSASMYLVIVR